MTCNLNWRKQMRLVSTCSCEELRELFICILLELVQPLRREQNNKRKLISTVASGIQVKNEIGTHTLSLSHTHTPVANVVKSDNHGYQKWFLSACRWEWLFELGNNLLPGEHRLNVMPAGSQGKGLGPSPGQFMIPCCGWVADGNKTPPCHVMKQPAVHSGHIPGKTACQERRLKRTMFDSSAAQLVNYIFRAISLNPGDWNCAAARWLPEWFGMKFNLL